MPPGAPRWPRAYREGPLQILDERRLPGRAVRLLEPHRRRDDRLVRPALGRQRDARRRAHQDRLAPGVDAERPGLEGAGEERVVKRPDRQQRLAVTRPGEAELGQQAHQVDLGDTELDVLALIGLTPMDQGERSADPVMALVDVPHADLVEPAAEVGGGRHVGAHRHYPGGRLGRRPGQVEQEPPQRLLVDSGPRWAPAKSTGKLTGALPRRLGAGQAAGGVGAGRGLGAAGGEAGPGRVRVGPEVEAEPAPLLAERRAEWLPGWPSVGRRQALIV